MDYRLTKEQIKMLINGQSLQTSTIRLVASKKIKAVLGLFDGLNLYDTFDVFCDEHNISVEIKSDPSVVIRPAVKLLDVNYLESIKILDDESGFNAEESISSGKSVYGLLLNNHLVGYVTISANNVYVPDKDLRAIIDTSGSKLWLSDLFILPWVDSLIPAFVKSCLSCYFRDTAHTVSTILVCQPTPDLMDIYKSIGFVEVDNTFIMKWDMFADSAKPLDTFTVAGEKFEIFNVVASSFGNINWVTYRNQDKSLVSTILVRDDESAILKLTQFLLKYRKSMVSLSSLPRSLQTLIIELYFSDNDMWFIDPDDYAKMEDYQTKYQQLQSAVPEDFADTICRNTNDDFIVLYPDLLSIINLSTVFHA